MTKVCSIFEPNPEPPFDVARHLLTPILPDDFMWEVSFSPREAQFSCYTKVPSKKLFTRDDVAIELGIVLKFKLTKTNELFVNELNSSKKHTSSSASGQMYARLREEILPSLKSRWGKLLLQSGVRCDFN